MTTKNEWITEEALTVEIDHPIQTTDLTDLGPEERDYYGDYKSQKNGYLTGGLYHYLIVESYIRSLMKEGMAAVPPTDAVVAVNLMPYAFYAGFSGKGTLFDTIRFPTSGKITNNITLCRCEDIQKPTAN